MSRPGRGRKETGIPVQVVIAGALILLGVGMFGWTLFRGKTGTTVVETFGQREETTQVSAFRDTIGLKEKKLAETGKVRVRILPQARCGPGDLTAIRIHERGRGPMLLSLEPFTVTEMTIPATSKRLSLPDLERGLTLEFDLKEKAREAPLGVYLCSDEGHNNRCAGKPAADINLMLRTPNGQLEPGDRIYFFQPILVKKGLLEAPTKNDGSLFAMRQLQAYTAARLGKTTAAATQGFEAAGALLKALDSVPLGLDMPDADVAVPLPYAELKECGRKGTTIGIAPVPGARRWIPGGVKYPQEGSDDPAKTPR